MVLNFTLKSSELRNSVRFAEKRSQVIVKLKERRPAVGRIDLMKKGLRQPALLDEGGGGLKNFKPGSLQWNQKEVKSRISLPGCSSSLDIKWAVKF